MNSKDPMDVARRLPNDTSTVPMVGGMLNQMARTAPAAPTVKAAAPAKTARPRSDASAFRDTFRRALAKRGKA